MTWSWYIPSERHDVLPLNLLDILDSEKSIYMTIHKLGHGSHILAFRYSASALGWTHKSSFDPVKEEGHDTIAQWMGWTLVSNEV